MSAAARARLAADLPSSRNLFNGPRSGGDENRNNLCYDSPRSSLTPNNDVDAGVSRGKFSPAQVKQMMDAWGKDSSDGSDDDNYQSDEDNETGSDGSNWNDEYLSPSKSTNSPENNDKRYLKSLQKGRHHLQYTHSTSPDATPDRYKEDEFQYQHHRISNYTSHMRRNPGSSESLGGSTANSSSENNGNDDGGGLGIGVFESAKNWLATQRERLHRLELERQVEDQRRKLVEEGRRRRLEEAEARRRWENRPAALEAREQQRLEAEREEPNSQMLRKTSRDNTTVQTISTLCGMTTPLDEADDDEYTAVARIDSSGRLVDLSSSEIEEYLKVGSPKKTLAKGYCVKVDLPQEDAEDLHKIEHHDSTQSRDNSFQENENSFEHQVKIVEEPRTEIPPILNEHQMKALIDSSALPASLDYCKWQRLYSLSRDGDSFDTFLRNVEGRDRTVLAVKTTLGKVFGGYADTRWESTKLHHQAHEFYGTGQACLFRFMNSSHKSPKLEIYKWSGANRYVQLCDLSKRIVAFGGGGDEGVFGLCIEDDFRRGTTGHCETFNNDPLCEEGYFDVVDLEVWGFTLDF